MNRIFWNCFFTIWISIQQIDGHGRMEDPPARNAAWRYGFNVPANYDDVGLNCGGLSVQKSNGGKCGICGDSYNGPRYHETGGKYATNIIVRHYLSGALMDVKILLSANHKGFMEFRLCPTLNSYVEVTQECLNQHLLHIEGFGTQYIVNEGIDLIFLRVKLPRNISCSRCVLQWRYHAGNNWGKDIQTGQACLGCGAQEEFYNCADISITARDISNNNSNLLNLPTTITQQIPSNNPVIISLSNSSLIIPKNLTFQLTTTMPKNLTYILSSSNHLITSIHKTRKILRCYPTNEALKPLIGIENWCLQLCTINCPPTLCTCVEI